MSYIVLSHSHWGLGQFFGGGGGLKIPGEEKKDSLPILGLQRLASLQYRGVCIIEAGIGLGMGGTSTKSYMGRISY